MSGLLRDRRALLALLVCAGIALTFWSGSRYPDLGEKAQMGGGVVLEDPLGFEALEQVDGGDPVPQRVLQTTLNWIATNQRGMAFGLALAAAFMTLFRRLGGVRFQGSFANTLFGVLIGAPLGVCVNCAAPIARGMQASGLRLETSLAAMISSPTLNFVVVGMMFALFPARLVLLKIGLGLFFVLALIPLLSRFVFRRERLAGTDPARMSDLSTGSGRLLDGRLAEASEGWWDAFRWVGRDYAQNLWFIVSRTVPLMLLAGLVGAIAVTALPWDVLSASLPRDDSWLTVGWLLGVAVFGLLLPVPIAFDVVVAGALYAAGVPAQYVMVLLFSLGIFSVYSFLIVWQAASLRVAVTLSVALVGLSVVAGGAAEQIESRLGLRHEAIYAALESDPPPVRPAPPEIPAEPAATLLPRLRERALGSEPVAVDAEPDLRVERRAFAPRPDREGPMFSKHYGEEVGLVRADATSVVFKFQRPFYSNWPVAAGDVHGDGWPDLLLGGDRGPVLYANLGGERFVRQAIDVPALAGMRIANAALVDLDGDGALDLVLAAYRGGNHVVYNRDGDFPATAFERLPGTGANLANSLAFGDLDRDGGLDVVLGNWTSGRWSARPPEASRDRVLWSAARGFEAAPLPGTPGETLTTLLSDLDQDGWLDLAVGNGYRDVSDYFYRGGADSSLHRILRSERVVPRTGQSTMSFDTADVDNDLVPELYVGQISGRRPGDQERFLDAESVCAEHSDPTWRARCERRMATHAAMRDARRAFDPSLCLSIADPVDRGDCVAYTQMRQAQREGSPARCDRIPDAWEALSAVCRWGFSEPAADAVPADEDLKQVNGRNLLLVRGPDGRFADRARELGVRNGGWTWNAKFADFDNDEWQDLYIANGFFPSKKRESNRYYRNLDGRRFEDATREVGLESHFDTLSWTAFDMDQDGDLDLVTVPGDGPVWLYRNHAAKGRSIAFSLRDERGNGVGIGSRVVIHYGPDAERRQLREIKASGGYLSFDPPVAHFGLGPYDRVSRVEVHWSTGETSTLAGRFDAGHHYTITRGGVSARASARTRASPSSPGT